MGGNHTTEFADDPDREAHIIANLLLNNLQANKQYRDVRSMVKLEGG